MVTVKRSIFTVYVCLSLLSSQQKKSENSALLVRAQDVEINGHVKSRL